jgi:mannitol-specific phosphotransferase system IIBC component
MAAVQGSEVKKVIIACEAGMGSSVLLVSQMKKRLRNYGVDVNHSPVNQIPDDADVVLCHQGLSARARQKVGGETPVLAFNTYLGDPVFDRLEEAVKNDDAIEG